MDSRAILSLSICMEGNSAKWGDRWDDESSRQVGCEKHPTAIVLNHDVY